MPQIIDRTAGHVATQPTTWQVIKPFLIIFAIIVVLGVLITLLTFWIMKKIKLSQDIYHRIHRQRRRLCSQHADKKRYLKWWKFRKNDVIKTMYLNSGKLKINTLGHYMGHYYGSEGNLVIAFANNRKWFFLWAEIELLIVNKLPVIHYETNQEITDEKGTKKIVKQQVEQRLPTDIEHFTDEAIMLNAVGVDKDERTGFYHPVLKDKNGQIVNLALPTFQSLKNVVLQSYLYEQTNSFVRIAKRSMDLNPNVRGMQKLSDSSQAIETRQEP